MKPAIWVTVFAVTVTVCTYIHAAEANDPDPAQGVREITPALCRDMKTGHTLTAKPKVGCDRLREVRFSYLGFDGQTHTDGQIVVLDAAAEAVQRIFATLLIRKFPVARAKSIHIYNGSDEASMADNNTSSFNDRNVAGSSSISMHAYGAAIDLNPIQNPYVNRSNGPLYVSPPAGASYVQRKAHKPGMAEEIKDVFVHNGFTVWGGDWKNPADYQHFQLPRSLVARLAALPAAEARVEFARHLVETGRCERDPVDLNSKRQNCEAALSIQDR